VIATEDVVNAVYTQINSGLEAQMLSVESSRTVTITRWKVLAKYFDYSRKVPAIEVIPVSVEIAYGDEDAPITESITYTDIDVYVYIAGIKPDENGEMLSRYAEAIVAVIDSDNTLGGVVDWAFVNEVEWDNVAIQREDKQMETSIRIGVRTKKHG